MGLQIGPFILEICLENPQKARTISYDPYILLFKHIPKDIPICPPLATLGHVHYILPQRFHSSAFTAAHSSYSGNGNSLGADNLTNAR